jgi:hypothetical protein
MKLGEAILLGSSVLAPRAGGQHFAETQEGCALGMAAVARGCTFRTWTKPFDERDRRTLGAEGVWGNWVLEQVERPCNCWRIRMRRKMRIKDIIAHLFDYHIMNKRNWTLEQLVAWVQTVEPKETRPGKDPRLVFRRQRPPSVQVERLRQETEEWQAVLYAFEARRASRSRPHLRREDRDNLPNELTS